MSNSRECVNYSTVITYYGTRKIAKKDLAGGQIKQLSLSTLMLARAQKMGVS